MSIYQKYCREVVGEDGALKSFELQYPADFNFGYDVADVLAEETPDKTALSGATRSRRSISFPFGM